jgi:hypothetical protein
MPTSRPRRRGAQVHHQDKEKSSTGAPAGKGEEEHRYTIRIRRRRAHANEQAKKKRDTCPRAGQGEEGHMYTIRHCNRPMGKGAHVHHMSKERGAQFYHQAKLKRKSGVWNNPCSSGEN